MTDIPFSLDGPMKPPATGGRALQAVVGDNAPMSHAADRGLRGRGGDRPWRRGARRSVSRAAGSAPGIVSQAFGESDGCPGTAAATLVTEFTASSPTAVELSVHVNVQRTTPFSTSIARGLAIVDLGDDGTPEYFTDDGAVDATIPAVLTSRPFAVSR